MLRLRNGRERDTFTLDHRRTHKSLGTTMLEELLYNLQHLPAITYAVLQRTPMPAGRPRSVADHRAPCAGTGVRKMIESFAFVPITTPRSVADHQRR